MFKRIYIEITNICNLNCSFCPATNRIKKNMSIEEFKTIIDKINNYTNHIYLHIKGEPLMHPNLDEILKICNTYKININITTNARLLKNKIDVINNNKIRQINISLHSFNDIEEIKELLNVIDKINNTYISLRLWNNKENKEVLELLSKHYNKPIVFNGKRVTLTNNIFLDKDILFDWPDIKKDVISCTGTCLGTKSQIGILVDGTVVPCCLDNDGIINLGNIFNNTLDEIINSSRFKEIKNGFNNNILKEELCKRCGYRTRFDK